MRLEKSLVLVGHLRLLQIGLKVCWDASASFRGPAEKELQLPRFRASIPFSTDRGYLNHLLRPDLRNRAYSNGKKTIAEGT
jgi:hypothetical protein